MTDAALPAWQKGYELSSLKSIAAIFREHDEGMILGAFGAYKENSVAEAMSAQRLHLGSCWAIDWETLARSRPIRDFSGQVRARAEAGDLYVKRIAYVGEEGLDGVADELRIRMADHSASWFLIWEEHEGDRRLMERLKLSWVCTKIKASSELTGVYLSDPGMEIVPPEPLTVPGRDRVGLIRLRDDLADLVADLNFAVEDTELEYADHYSGYNLRHSWSALALRGYGGHPDFIIKPSEMSKKWKKENAEKLDWELADTPLRVRLPEAEELIATLPGRPHRIRLMRLAPGGGELARHADITDPDAGTEIGQLLRLHFPLRTNEDCVFESWDLRGERTAATMKPGECWYLDTRKPHTARNGGVSERLHLVVDMEVRRRAPRPPTVSWPLLLQPCGGRFVIRDDLIYGGSKRRALDQIMKPDLEYVFAGPGEGYAHVALASTALTTGSKVTAVVADRKVLLPNTAEAERRGAKLIRVRPGYLTNVQAKARAYAERSKKRVLLPLGLDLPEFRPAMIGALRAAGAEELEPPEVWAAAGSGALCCCLQAIWPRAQHFAIEVGRKLEQDDVLGAEIVEVPESFGDSAKDPPPFPSCANYDAKIWQAFKPRSKPGAFYWNVAA